MGSVVNTPLHRHVCTHLFVCLILIQAIICINFRICQDQWSCFGEACLKRPSTSSHTGSRDVELLLKRSHSPSHLPSSIPLWVQCTRWVRAARALFGNANAEPWHVDGCSVACLARHPVACLVAHYSVLERRGEVGLGIIGMSIDLPSTADSCKYACEVSWHAQGHALAAHAGKDGLVHHLVVLSRACDVIRAVRCMPDDSDQQVKREVSNGTLRGSLCT